MRVADLWPVLAMAGSSDELLRDLDDLNEREWGDLIGTFGDLTTAFEHAEAQATEEWAARFPREVASA
jgi:hypothetical protein